MKLTVLTLLCAVAWPSAAQLSPRVIQTNSAGDNVHVIDPATNKVVGTIEGIDVSHGTVIAPGGARI
jgi:DNA-binding beta-propeller fold protein YncE